MLQAYAYLLHLVSCLVLMGLFFVVYTWLTPFDELGLIRKGNTSAALTLAGAMLGFCITLASSVLHSDSWLLFVAWAVGAMLVLSVAYAVITRAMPQMNAQIEANNNAMGGLLGCISLVVGITNAACLY